ncbi:hypothetical protein Pcinc_043294 [Petrolisthes cinctipes]|uniref:Uncharacterized protein n=1 Tax=Petrolisthes cinctipes TaxID=88211 RepID=A0AAE1EI11_PETCI|nr:hypothetical protein Pcinc_043294 [Petrolisthes cinctipes]
MMTLRPNCTHARLTRNFMDHHCYRHRLYSENSSRVMKLLTDGNVVFTHDRHHPHTSQLAAATVVASQPGSLTSN